MLENNQVALIGCGKLGQRLATRLISHGAKVHGFRRNSQLLPEAIIAHSIDVQKVHSLTPLSDIAFDYVVISLTAGAYNKEAYQKTYLQGLVNILKALNTRQLKRLFWVSSTSVYGQNDDSLVDEQSPTEPTGFSGEVQLQAEALLLEQEKSTIVRFSGIYNSESYRLIDRLKAGTIGKNIEAGAYSNRIHIEDCAAVLEHLILLDKKALPVAPLYLATDNCPVPYKEVIDYLADQLAIELPELPPASYQMAGSKRCCNQRLLDSGYQFIYPDFKAGLKALIEKEKAC